MLPRETFDAPSIMVTTVRAVPKIHPIHKDYIATELKVLQNLCIETRLHKSLSIIWEAYYSSQVSRIYVASV